MATRVAVGSCCRLWRWGMALPQATRLPHTAAVGSQPSQLRCFTATASPRRRPNPNSLYERVRFTAADVPGLDFWEKSLVFDFFEDLNPELCLTTAEKYVDLAIADTPGWRQALLGQSEDLSLRTLHYIAAALLSGPRSPSWHLAMHILHSNVLVGYPASILVMTRLSLRSGRVGQPAFALAEQAFSRIAARRQDPNACALQGLIYAARGDKSGEDKAVEWLAHALAIGMDRPKPLAEDATSQPAEWEWGASASVALGQLYIKRNRLEDARQILTAAVDRWDDPGSTHLLSTLLDDQDPARLQLLEKAAASGYKAAARDLSNRALGWARDERYTRAERAEFEVVADEWSMLAGDKALP